MWKKKFGKTNLRQIFWLALLLKPVSKFPSLLYGLGHETWKMIPTSEASTGQDLVTQHLNQTLTHVELAARSEFSQMTLNKINYNKIHI